MDTLGSNWSEVQEIRIYRCGAVGGAYPVGLSPRKAYALSVMESLYEVSSKGGVCSGRFEQGSISF